MKLTISYIILIIFSSFQMQSYGQLKLDDIKTEQIQQRKIRKFIKNNIQKNKHQFNEIHPSWNRGEDLSLYRKNEMIFYLNSNVQDVWQGYLSTNPSNSWNGRKISLGLLLQKFPGKIYYQNDQIIGIDTGQVYFLNLKLLLGIINIPVAFEIITIDPVEKVLEFSYLEGNKSSGVQQVKFIDINGERTEIKHISYYKSDSPFRDKYIYPFFHKKIINDFHQNMKRLLNL
jgi:hypothetical protein